MMNEVITNKIEDTLFTDDFPVLSSEDELEEIKKKYSHYCDYYIVSGCSEERKEKFDRLWKVFKRYADSHFLKQYKTQFHQRSWEMYIGCVLLKNNLSIKSLDEGPDFIVNNDHYIECVACNNAEEGKPDHVPALQYGVAQDVPVEQIIMRITSTIKDKYYKYAGNENYKGWAEKGLVHRNKPYIIAINSGIFPYPQDYIGIPLIIKALFGLQYLQIDQNRNKSFSWRQNTQKGISSVPVNYFTDDAFKEISAIIFSDRDILNHPDVIGDDCFFVNNPFAANQIDFEKYSFLKRWKAEKDKITKLY